MMLVIGVNLVGISAGARMASLFTVAKLLTPTNTATRAAPCRALALECAGLSCASERDQHSIRKLIAN